jgi:hypothetical protein
MLVENGLKIIGDVHDEHCAHIGAAGVARRITTSPRAGGGDQDTEYLTDDLTAITATSCNGEHRQVRSHVWPGPRLAQNVRAFEMCPLSGDIGTRSRRVGLRPFVVPGVAQSPRCGGRRGVALS